MSKIIIISIFVVAVGLAEAALHLDNESELREAQASLFHVNAGSGWLLLNYVGPNTVHFVAAGEGGASDVVDHLADDQIQYVLIREQTRNNGARDVFVTWIGSAVGNTEKGEKSALLGDAQTFLQPYHTALTVSSKGDFNDDTIIDLSGH